MTTTLEAAALLRLAATLQVGDALPSLRVNPMVSGIRERELHRAIQYELATHHRLPVRDLGEIADQTGEPLYIQDTIGERDLTRARAVLRGRMLDMAYVDWTYQHRLQGSPVNEETLYEATRLVTFALSMKQQREAA